jgi:hypothetical protein
MTLLDEFISFEDQSKNSEKFGNVFSIFFN